MPAERYAAVVRLGHAGATPENLAQVRAALADPSPLVRVGALGALHRLGHLSVEQLRRAFDDPAGEVRARAAELAAHVNGVDASRLLDDPDPRVVEVAAFSCGEQTWSANAPVDKLARVAREHDDALCRESAAAALGAIGDPFGLDAVLDACSDRVTVRRRATLALAAFDDPRAEAQLHTALDDKDWQVRQAAEDLLQVGRRFTGDEDPGAYAD